jgi:chemotaxis protein MotB
VPVNRQRTFGKEAIHMARMHLQLIGLAALSFALTGCVTSADKYRALQLENESLRTQNGESQAQARAALAERDVLQKQIAAMSEGDGGKVGLIQNQAQQIAALSAQLADINAKYQEALSRPIAAGSPLDPVVTNALTTFAQQNPDVVDFDAARGIVKFKTDFTFATGSDALTDKAKQAITRFASILNSQAASSYELMVAGHTDNTPVANPATKARHPDNWYLSSHRAIAVGSELVRGQVSPQRVAVVGYADQRPVASNTTTQGKAQNRRVEVLILPSTVRSTVVKSASTPKAAGTPKTGLNKDQVAPIDRGPVYNK